MQIVSVCVCVCVPAKRLSCCCCCCSRLFEGDFFESPKKRMRSSARIELAGCPKINCRLGSSSSSSLSVWPIVNLVAGAFAHSLRLSTPPPKVAFVFCLSLPVLLFQLTLPNLCICVCAGTWNTVAFFVHDAWPQLSLLLSPRHYHFRPRLAREVTFCSPFSFVVLFICFLSYSIQKERERERGKN